MTRQLAGPRRARTTLAGGPDMAQPDPDGPDPGRPDPGRPEPRIGEPAVEKEYSIEAVTARLDDLYERLAARRRWRAVLRTTGLRAGGSR